MRKLEEKQEKSKTLLGQSGLADYLFAFRDTVSKSVTRKPIPGHAIASVVFACASLWMFRVYGQVHWLPTRLSKDSGEVFRQMLSKIGPIRDQLDIGYKVLALAALIWCIWSWRTEQRMAAIVATAFAAFAVICSVFIVI